MHSLPMLLRRVAAFAYDSLLMLAAFFVVTGVAVWLNDMAPVRGPAYYALLWLVAGAFLVVFWRNGRTLGMQAWKLRIVPAAELAARHADPDRIPFDGVVPAPRAGALVLRYLSGSALPVVTWAWMLVDRDGLALHDRLSGTRVVRGRG